MGGGETGSETPSGHCHLGSGFLFPLRLGQTPAGDCDIGPRFGYAAPYGARRLLPTLDAQCWDPLVWMGSS